MLHTGEARCTDPTPPRTGDPGTGRAPGAPRDRTDQAFRLVDDHDTSRGRVRGLLRSLWTTPLEHLLGLRQLQRRYARLPASASPEEFARHSLASLDVRIELDPSELENIPASGPCLVVANHPFGVLDGLVLVQVLRGARQDARLLANGLLARIDELREHLIAVDVLGLDPRANARALRSAIQWLSAGGALGTFPSGTVSRRRPGTGVVTDPAWSTSTAWLARRAEAPIVPVWFAGENSRLFQWIGTIDDRLRTALLAREALNKRHRVVRLRIGRPIPPERLSWYGDDRTTTEYLRFRTYALGAAPAPAPAPAPAAIPVPATRAPAPIAAPMPPALIERELLFLPAAQRLVRASELEVIRAEAAQIPHALREIGRQREIAFRAVGEGTGLELDLDAFDQDYTHLLCWDHTQRRVAGAYRLRDVGADGAIPALYTRTLFEFGQPLLDRVRPGLELGRSFVAPGYQRASQVLFLLWKGIGRHVVEHPAGPRWLFGPVSISNAFAPLSRRLMMDFVRRKAWAHDLAPLVTPRHPPREWRTEHWDARAPDEACVDVSELQALVREIEHGQRDVPVLLREYLRLGGKIAAFNVDPGFQDALDGLVVVDLARTDRRLLDRYLGADGAARFLAQHAQPSPALVA